MATGARALLAALLAGALLLVYWPALWGPFLFDDLPSLVDSPGLREGDFLRMAFGEPQSPLSNRVLVCLSFVLNHALHGMAPFGYHIVNLLLHWTNGLLLWALAAAALRGPNVAAIAPGLAARASRIGFALAALWTLHPLATDAVAYVTQRTTLLMATMLLLALLATARAAQAERPGRWRALAILAAVLAMASKEEAAALPLLVPLWLRAFHLPSLRALRPHLGFVLGLAGTAWAALLVCVLLGPPNATVGWSATPRVDAFESLLTQAPVVTHYAWLAVWPQPLRAAYDWDVVRTVGPVVLPGLLVLAALLGTVWLWRARPWWGLLGAWFFLLLAPTSSILPIVTELAAERRAYLPVLAVLAPLLLLGERLLRGAGRARWLALLLVLAVLATLARPAAARFGDPAAFWASVEAHNELRNGSVGSALILGNLGHQAAAAGRLQEAHDHFWRALQGQHPGFGERLNFAGVLVSMGRLAEAEPLLRALVAERPQSVTALGNLVTCLLAAHEADLRRGAADGRDPRLRETEDLARQGMALAPAHAGLANGLGMALLLQGRAADAEPCFRAAIGHDPSLPQGYLNLGAALLAQGRRDEAVALWRRLLPVLPGDAELRWRLAVAILDGDRQGAVALLQEALRLDPGHSGARGLLGRIGR